MFYRQGRLKKKLVSRSTGLWKVRREVFFFFNRSSKSKAYLPKYNLSAPQKKNGAQKQDKHENENPSENQRPVTLSKSTQQTTLLHSLTLAKSFMKC